MVASFRDRSAREPAASPESERGPVVRLGSARSGAIGRLEARGGGGDQGARIITVDRLKHWHTPPKRRRWGVRSMITAGLVALLVLVLAGVGWYRPAGLGPDAASSVRVVWRAALTDPPRVSAVNRAAWDDFVAGRRADLSRSRTAILDQARTEMAQSLKPIFADMKNRIADYTGWFYMFFTNYRMGFTAVIAVLGHDSADGRPWEQVAADAINRMLQDRFFELVVAPERFGPAVEVRARAVLRQAIERERVVADSENQALARFMTEHGRPIEDARPDSGDAPGAVVLSWESLGIAPDAAAMAAPPEPVQLIKTDPALSAVQTSTGAEGLFIVGRQLVRRSVNVALNAASQAYLVPMVAGSAVLGPAEWVVSPLLGSIAFFAGFGAEYPVVKARQAIEGPQLQELAESVVDRLSDSQSQALSEAVVKRIETWLGG